MRLDYIHVRSAGPFKDAELDLRTLPGPVVALTGENGAGKSFLLEAAIPGAMFRTMPTQGKLVKRATARDGFLESHLVNGRPYKVRHLLDGVSGKSEATAFDERDQPCFDSAKVSDFDAWADRTWPARELLYTSTFHPQASAGFVGLDKGERKAVILRALLLDRYEVMAKSCRERANVHATEAGKLEARISEQREASDPTDFWSQSVSAAALRVTVTAGNVDVCRAKLAEAQEARTKYEADLKLHRAAVAARAELVQLRDKSAAESEDLAQRVFNNEGLIEQATQIRDAVAENAELTDKIAGARVDVASLNGSAVAASGAASAALAAESQLRDRLRAQRQREEQERAKLKLVDEAKIEAARAQLDDAFAAEAAAEVLVRDAGKAVVELTEKRSASAEDRVSCLRVGLDAIVHVAKDKREAVSIAKKTLDEDDRADTSARTVPQALREARETLSEASDRHAVASRAHRDLVAIVAKEGEVRAARDGIAWVEGECARIEAELITATEARFAAEQEQTIATERVRVARMDLERMIARQAELAPLVKLEKALANAEARLQELKPRLDAVRAELAERNQKLAAPPERDLTPPQVPPEAAVFQSQLSAAEKEHAEAIAFQAKATEMVRQADQARERIRTLQAELDHELAEHADWARLAEDLGRNGLQALEIDAAGPALSSIANDLLHSAYGSRWTVSLETTRPNADGSELLEACEYRVLDTERGGHERDAKEFSGGERVILNEAAMLAITVLSCRKAGLTDVTLVRDESGAALDGERARAYVKMLRRAADMVGARHIFFVAHNPDLWTLADARVHVADGRIEVQ